MKKIILILAAVVCSFVTTECIVRYIIRYPVYGIAARIEGIRKSDGGVQRIHKPHSAYWTVEGGNRVFRRNNLGLTGIPVDTTVRKKYVFVLGSSFIEAFQFPPESIATSVYQGLLNRNQSEFSVLNLGASGHDPYDSYFYASYYERIFYPSYVVLVLTNISPDWPHRHRHPLDFSIGENFGKPVVTASAKVLDSFRNVSSFLTIVSGYISIKLGAGNIERGGMIQSGEVRDSVLFSISDDLLLCLNEFNKKFKERFILISILGSRDTNEDLKAFCLKEGIRYYASEILVPVNQINGNGHLNGKGNEYLGEFLYGSVH